MVKTCKRDPLDKPIFNLFTVKQLQQMWPTMANKMGAHHISENPCNELFAFFHNDKGEEIGHLSFHNKRQTTNGSCVCWKLGPSGAFHYKTTDNEYFRLFYKKGKFIFRKKSSQAIHRNHMKHMISVLNTYIHRPKKTRRRGTLP